MSAGLIRMVRAATTGMLSAAVLTMAAVGAEAKTLYVNGTSGNDSVTYAANGPNAPWRTISRATGGAGNNSEAARAGDVVIVMAGTYSVAGTNSRNIPAYNPVNSGTAGSPITFQAEGVVRLRLSSGNGSVIGSNSRNFITWRGFTIHEAEAPSASDTGPVTVWFCNGCVLEGLDINGNGDAGARQDNHTGIRVEWSTNITIRNNLIRNVYTGHNVNNGAAIMTYDTGNGIIENNEILDSGAGIFLKGNDDPSTLGGWLIRYNRISRTQGAAFALHINPSNQPTTITQNLVTDSNQGVRIWGLAPNSQVAQMKTIRFVANTLHNCDEAIYFGNNPIAGADHLLDRNIVSNSRTAAIFTLSGIETFEPSRLRFTSNVYFANAMLAHINAEDSSATRLADFNAWRGRFPNYDAQGGNVDPRYVNAAGGDFRLQPGSPAAGRGAYLVGNEVIGRTSGPPAGSGLPSAPTGLRIVPGQ